MQTEMEKQEMHTKVHNILEVTFFAKATFRTARDTFALFGVLSSFLISSMIKSPFK